MTDNVTITSGANSTPPPGIVIATDDVGSIHYPISKIALGANNEVDALLDSGPQTPANSVPVVEPSATNTYGENAAVPSGNTVTLVSYSAGAAWRFSGFIGSGEVDGRFFVQFNAVTKYVFRTNIAQRQAELKLPHPDAAAGGTTVTLKVENTGADTGAYEGTLLGV